MNTTHDRFVGRLLTQVGTVLAVWTVLVFVSMLTLWVWPRTMVGLLVCLTAGPVVHLLGTAVAEGCMGGVARLAFVARLHEKLEWYTRRQTISPLRIGVLLVEVLVSTAACGALAYGLSALVPLDLDEASAFWNRHFWW